MPRVSKEKAADNLRKATRLRRSKAGVGKGAYLRAIVGEEERWDLTVEGADGRKRVRHLSIPTTASNEIFKAEIERVRSEIAVAETAESGDGLERWISLYIEERGLAENTQKTLRCACRGFGLNPEQNRRRVLELKSSGFKPSALRTKLKHVRALFTFMASKGVKIEQPVEGKIRDGAPRSRVPTDGEIDLLLRAVDGNGGESDRLYVRLLMATGARTSTVEAIRPCDMDTATWGLQLYNVKCSRKYGILHRIMDAETQRLWGIVTATVPQDQPLFTHCHHDRLLRRMHALFGRDANGETLSVHSLRRAYATRLARGGVPVAMAARLLDDSPTIMLRHYVTVQQQEIDQLYGLGENKKSEGGKTVQIFQGL